MKETVYARRAQWYGGSHFDFGSPISVSSNDAKILVALRRAQREPINGVVAKPEEGSEAISGASGVDYSSMDKEALREAYKSVFGRAAHGRTSEETIREELEKAKGESNASED